MPYDSIDSSGYIEKSALVINYSTGDITTSSTGEHPMVWAREKIAQRTTKMNRIPMFYKEALRYVISKLGTLVYINSETELIDVKCVHANPERTIGKLEQDNNIILPIVSINQNQSQNADSRRRGAPQIVNEVLWSDARKRAVRVISEAPRAVDIEYGLNIWCKYKADMDQLCEQIRLLFNPHLVVKNSYTNTAMAYIDSENDQSTLEVADREERILQRTFNLKLEAYIPNPKFLITNTGEIEELGLDSTIY